MADSRWALVENLRAFSADQDAPGLATGQAVRDRPPRTVFVFTGMGAPWWAMGRELLAREPVFASQLEQCDALLEPLSGWSLLEELTADEDASRIGQPWLDHVANFAVQAALAALWQSWGVVPDAVCRAQLGGDSRSLRRRSP